MGVIAPLALRMTCQRDNPRRKPTRPCPDPRNRVANRRLGGPRTAAVSPCAERARPSMHLPPCPAESGRPAARLLPDHRATQGRHGDPARACSRTSAGSHKYRFRVHTDLSPPACAPDTPCIGVPRSRRFSGTAWLKASGLSEEGR